MIPLPLILAGMGTMASSEGRDFAMSAGKKIIKGSIAAGTKATKVGFVFVKGGTQALTDSGELDNKNPDIKTKKLDKSLPIIENGLSVPASFHENQTYKLNDKISDDLEIIKGQNEIMFLSNSIRYFIESHLGRTGVDRGISYALQYDMKAVTNHLKANPSLRFPGYLLHQATSLYKTIEEMNTFYTSILNDGCVKKWTLEEAREEIQRSFGLEKNAKIIKGYIPFELQLPVQREILQESSEEKRKPRFQKLFSSSEEEINDVAHDALFVLANELIANENLEHEVHNLIKRQPGHEITIEAPPLKVEDSI